MRTKRHTIPGVERLESMTLLSAAAGGLAELAKTPPAITSRLASGVEASAASGFLTGTLSGVYTLNPRTGALGATARGNLAPLGVVTFSGRESLASIAESGRLTVATRQGKVALAYTTDSYTTTSFSGSYTIVGVSGRALRGDVGQSGHVVGTLTPATSTRGSFSLTFS